MEIAKSSEEDKRFFRSLIPDDPAGHPWGWGVVCGGLVDWAGSDHTPAEGDHHV